MTDGEMWRRGYEFGDVLEDRFPGQAGGHLAMAVVYQSAPVDLAEVRSLTLLRRGHRGDGSWVWSVVDGHGWSWQVVGSCGLAGWSEDSHLFWQPELLWAEVEQ